MLNHIVYITEMLYDDMCLLDIIKLNMLAKYF